ncbi:type I polyketide synthase, partial [Hyalangium sp.]|uniref:type I polyketide synthase n=1 Tax=Hyalangium sp. TaxID=2028555 RepID=UPI002D33AD77
MTNPVSDSSVNASGDGRRPAATIEAWLRGELSRALGIPADAIDATERFRSYGLDSARATALVSRLSAFLGRPLGPTLMWEQPTLQMLTEHLARGETRGVSAPGSAPAAGVAGAQAVLDEPIAIVGLACRFPGGATSPLRYWSLLREGVDAISEVPPERWSLARHYSADSAEPGKMSTRWGGFLQGVDQFDPLFFGISPREAAQMDPQQRLMLELAWEGLEDAHVIPASLRDSLTGVFVGTMWSDYARLAAAPQYDLYTATGHDTSILAGRVSYALGLQGPSMVVNTACSSSLVSLHLACQSLRSGESTLALAGGISLVLSPLSTVAMSKFGAMSPDGRCKAFDARANGYVRSEGGGIAVLKRLSRALIDGDRIYCVVRGSAVNNDGFSNGLTAPNPKAQEAVLQQAYARARVRPDRVHYVETHGPGTALGDPIEAGALGAVLGQGRGVDRPLRIGSVKTNLGHLEAAAGIAGLAKVALALQHRAIPRSLHFESGNPHIDFDALRLQVVRELTPWPSTGEPPVAGVSSFGFGGTNCHVVLEAGPSSAASLLPLAAESGAALQRRVLELMPVAAGLQQREELQALCKAAGLHLSRGPYRAALVASSPQELFEKLTARIREAAGGKPVGARPAAVFVFPGHGSQWAGMGRRLLASAPVFRAKLEECDRIFRPLAGWSLLEELVADASRLGEVEVVQAMLLAVQVSLAALWRSWGIEPDVVLGHSV